ncbi:MAG: hypothetical protein ACP5OZ_04365 [Candidatus Woesearchaeota archaeon]
MTRKSRRAQLKVTPRWLREQKTFESRTGKFPNCKGTYPDCPESIDQNNPPEQCRKCPKYRL